VQGQRYAPLQSVSTVNDKLGRREIAQSIALLRSALIVLLQVQHELRQGEWSGVSISEVPKETFAHLHAVSGVDTRAIRAKLDDILINEPHQLSSQQAPSRGKTGSL
jgi:hypothetical protein